VTSGSTLDMAPTWSPDGKWIAYTGASGDQSEIWVAAIEGGSPPRRITTGAHALRVRWDRLSDDLLVSAMWEAGWVSIRRVGIDGSGAARPLAPPLIFGHQADYAEFDLSPDGGLLAFSQEHPRGDVWVVKAKAGSF